MKKNNLRFFFSIIFTFFCFHYSSAQLTSLISPTNDFYTGEDSVFFSWNHIDNYSYYELNLAEDNVFSINNKVFKIYQKNDTILKNLSKCKTYFWRIRAVTGTPGPYSAIRTFTIYTPSCVTGLELWLDASSGLTVNGSNEITDWQDRSGKNKNATQKLAGSQPIKINETSPTSNKRTFVRLDGADDFLDLDSSANLRSFFSVFNWKGSLPNFSGYNTVVTSKVTKVKNLLLLGIPGTSKYYDDGTFNTFTPPEIEVNGVNTVDLAPLNQLKIFNGIKNGAVIPFTNFFIGKFPNDPTSFWNGDIGDLIIFNTALDTLNKQKIQHYLNDKYAPSVNLGADTIVCSFPFIIKGKKDYFTNYKWQDGSTADSILINAPGKYSLTTTNIFGKISSDTIIISQDTVSFTVNLGSDICSDKPVQLYAGPGYYNYTWSTGATGNKIYVTSTGSYWVSVKDCKGNISTDTINITIHPLPVFSLGADTTLCYYSSKTLGPGFLNSANYNFLWSDNSTDSILKVNKNGIYTLKVTDNAGCVYTDSISIAVDSALYKVSLGPDITVCAGNYIFLKTTSATITKYLWSDSSTNDSLKVMISGQYSLNVSNNNGCFKSDTITVTISGNAPTANFTTIPVCVGNISQFTDMSSPPSGETIAGWNWDFGDGSSSTLQNPSHVYTDSGSYAVRLTVTTGAGCFDEHKKSSDVYPYPVVDFSSRPSPCENSLMQFNGTANSGSYTISKWDWNFGDSLSGINNTSLLKNPNHHFTGNLIYKVKLSVTNNKGCISSITKDISGVPITTSPQALLPNNQYSSPSSTITFSWSAVCGALYYELDIADDVNFVNNNKVYKVYNLSADTTLGPFESCKKKYWRVKAFAPKETAYSEIYSFTFFSPSCISGLEMWLDASSNIVKDTAGFVSIWKDRGSKNKNAMQTLSSNQPKFYKETEAISNKSSFIRFDGTNDFLSIDTSLSINTLYVVFDWKGSLPNFSGYNTIITSQKSLAKNYILLGVPGKAEYYIDGTFNTFTADSVKVNDVSTISMAPLERLKIFEGKALPTKLIEKSLIGTFPNDATSFWNGNIGDIIVYNIPLKTDQKNIVKNYLNDKYAPDVSLGADQTVCGFPVVIRAKKNYFVNYLWQDASTADSIIVNAPGKYSVSVTNVFGKISKDTIEVKQELIGYVVNLGKDTSTCAGNTIRLLAGPSYLSYQWSTGSKESSIIVTSPGNYSVEVKDCLGKISKDTIHVTINPLPVFSFGKDTVLCNSTNFILDPGFLNSKNLQFNWFDNTHDSIHPVNKSGNYSLKVIDDKGCLFSDTIQIIKDSLKQLVSLGPDTTLCSGNYIYLKSGADKAIDYLWSTGSVNDSLQITTSGTYWVNVKSINNCLAVDTVTISVSGVAPVAYFSSSKACVDKAVTFTDSSTSAMGTIISWNWNFGDGFTSNQQNPAHIFSDTLIYNVRLTIKTSSGCTASLLRLIKVKPIPKLTYTATSTCEKSQTLFDGIATTFGYPVMQWSWNFGDPASGANNASNLKAPSHKYGSIGKYAIQLIAINGLGCSDTLKDSLAIHNETVADFTNIVACRSSETAFKDISFIAPGSTIQSSYWNFGDNSNSTLLNPSHTYFTISTYTVTHSIVTSYGCKDTVTKTISVYASPTLYMTQSKICQDTITTFTDLSIAPGGTISQWKWKFNDADSVLTKNAGYVFTKTGNAKVELTVTTDKGCSGKLAKTVVVNPAPNASFTYTPTYGNPKLKVNFTNTSVGTGLTYFWNFDDGATSSLLNPTHIYSDTGTYRPFLMVRNSFNCSDTEQGVISILKRRMDVSIDNIVTTLQNGFLNVSAQITNKGTADVLIMDVYISIKGAGTIRESWSGKLLKGTTTSTTFQTAIALENLDHFICISLQKPNGFDDEYPADNEKCDALEVTDFKIFEIYPNPVSEILTIPVVTPHAGDLKITLFDASGAKIRIAYQNVVLGGLQLIQIESRDLNAGLYSCTIEYDDQVVIKKFIKN